MWESFLGGRAPPFAHVYARVYTHTHAYASTYSTHTQNENRRLQVKQTFEASVMRHLYPRAQIGIQVRAGFLCCSFMFGAPFETT